MSDQPLLTWKGRRVRSPGDGPQTAARKVPPAPLRPGSLFFIPSPLEGWGVDVLLDRLPEEGAIVLYEKDPDLEAVMTGPRALHLGLRENDPRLFVLQEDSEEAVQRLFSTLPLSRLRRCEFLTLNGAWMAHGPRYREVFARLEEGLTRWWSNRMTCLYMGPLWIRNLFDNLRSEVRRFTPWPDWGTDPVLVCGAGVTLEEVLPWASENRTRIRVIAADTALPVLRAAELVPDAAVCLEAQHANLRDFAGWTGSPVQLFTDLTSFPPGTRVFGPEPCWFISRFAEISLWDRWPWPEVPILPPLGSVGVAAAWVAWRLTRGQVILAGLDFSYPPGKSHARGAPALASLAARTDRYRPMEQPGSWERPGIRRDSGTQWLTSPVMDGYAAMLRQQAGPEAGRTFVWEQRGIDLGLARFDRSLPAGPLGPRGAQAHPGSNGPGPWLEDEQARWHRLLQTFEVLNASPQDSDAVEALAQALKEVDYLTFVFPDPEFRAASDWLTRALVQLRWITGRISRLRPT